MTMNPFLRKLTLTLHVLSSVGWLGSVAVFLALALVGLNGDDPQKVRGAYIAMDMTAWYVIVPLALTAFITGLVISLGTVWGLFRHYWVLVKLLITILSTVILLIHLQPIRAMADVATHAALASGDHVEARLQLVVSSAGGIVALLVAQVLSVYKPRGLTPYGWRKQREIEAVPRL